jgi:hypothetical protein
VKIHGNRFQFQLISVKLSCNTKFLCISTASVEGNYIYICSSKSPLSDWIDTRTHNFNPLATGFVVILAFGILHPPVCNFSCFLFSSLQIFKYTTCFGPTGHLQVHNLVSRCRPFKVTVTAAGSFLGWHYVAVHVLCIYGFTWSNFLSCFGVRQFGYVYFQLIQFTLLCGNICNKDKRKYQPKAARRRIKYTKTQICVVKEDVSI